METIDYAELTPPHQAQIFEYHRPGLVWYCQGETVDADGTTLPPLLFPVVDDARFAAWLAQDTRGEWPVRKVVGIPGGDDATGETDGC